MGGEYDYQADEKMGCAERRKLLMAMLDAVYVGTVEEKSVVAIRPKPALRPLFEIATTRQDSNVVLLRKSPLTLSLSKGEHTISRSWFDRLTTSGRCSHFHPRVAKRRFMRNL